MPLKRATESQQGQQGHLSLCCSIIYLFIFCNICKDGEGEKQRQLTLFLNVCQCIIKNYNPLTSVNKARQVSVLIKLRSSQKENRTFEGLLPTENKLLLDVLEPQNVDKRVHFKFDYSTTTSRTAKWRERHEAQILWKVQVHAGKSEKKVTAEWIYLLINMVCYGHLQKESFILIQDLFFFLKIQEQLV